MSPAVAAGLQVACLVVLLAVLYIPLGDYMARVFTSDRDLGIERLLYRLARVDPRREQSWRVYALGVLAFSAISTLALYVIQRVQHWLPPPSQPTARSPMRPTGMPAARAAACALASPRAAAHCRKA